MADKKITKKSVVPEKEAECCPKGKILKKHLLFLAVLVILIAVLGYFFKDKIIAATVNGKPIFRQQLNKKLSSTYGKEILENMIVEDLIRNEANKQGIAVAKENVDKEIEKVKGTLGQRVKLEDVLSYQGVSLSDFESQIKLRLQVNKIVGKDITVTDEEISSFLKDNAKTLVATGEAEKKEEAKQALKEQKINDKVQTWISDLLSKAKISRFLK